MHEQVAAPGSRRPRSPKVLGPAAFAVASLLAAGEAAGAEENPAAPRVALGSAAGPLRVDGVLDEPGWSAAGVIADLTQQSPVPGGPSPYRTSVRLLSDGRTIYLGVRCDDPEPGKIGLHTMQRDADLEGDDTISFVLDTFGDQRTGYYFQLNAAAARHDGLIVDQEDVSPDWDGIWDAAAIIDAGGWTLEVAIPAATLRFEPGLDAWGFNISRFVARDRTTLRWQGTTLDARLPDMRRAGALEGVASLQQGIGLTITPYGLARSRTDFLQDDTDTTGDVGLDAAYALTDGLSGVLTLNTDFAETEVDTRQINLTRFPLFYPEKRYFFVEGANQFEFGTGITTSFIPFFSRRIGLFNDEVVPIDAGLKVIGRQGKLAVGVLDVQTGETPDVPSTNLFAGRVTWDVDDHLRVGGIATRGRPDGQGENHLGGIDALWQTSTLFGDKNFSVGGWWSRTGGDPPPVADPIDLPGGHSDGWGFKVDYPNDLWDNAFVFRSFGESLDPALGFLPRSGVRWYTGGLSYRPRPTSGFWEGKARQFFFDLYPTYITDHSGEAQSWEVFIAPFLFETPAGGHVEADLVPMFERLDAPFEIVPGVAIAEGRYRFTRYILGGSTRPDRPVSGKLIATFGDFYDGRLTQWEGTVRTATPSGALQLQLDGLYITGELPAGDFISRLWQVKTAYSLSPDLVFSIYGQYDSESRNIGMNARMRWTIEPGVDLYAVWTRGWLHPPGAESALEGDPIDAEAVVKLRWTFRM